MREAILFSICAFATVLAMGAWFVAEFLKREVDDRKGQVAARIQFLKLENAYPMILPMGFYFVALVLSILILPTYAKLNSLIDCDTGYPWEIHAISWCYFMLGATLEAFLYRRTEITPLGLYPIAKAFAFGTLVKVDLYTDILFPFLASECEGSEGFAIVSTVLLCLGVVCCQWILPGAIFFGTNLKLTNGEPADAEDLLPVLIAEMSGFKLVAQNIMRVDCTIHGGASLAALRCCFEDAGQNVLKVCFMLSRNKLSTHVFADVCVSMVFSMAAVVQGAYQYFIVGTSLSDEKSSLKDVGWVGIDLGRITFGNAKVQDGDY